jgi:hypothetical protein
MSNHESKDNFGLKESTGWFAAGASFRGVASHDIFNNFSEFSLVFQAGSFPLRGKGVQNGPERSRARQRRGEANP